MGVLLKLCKRGHLPYNIKITKKYTISMGVQRYENLILYKDFRIVLSMVVHRKLKNIANLFFSTI